MTQILKPTFIVAALFAISAHAAQVTCDDRLTLTLNADGAVMQPEMFLESISDLELTRDAQGNVDQAVELFTNHTSTNREYRLSGIAACVSSGAKANLQVSELGIEDQKELLYKLNCECSQ